jgi:hypothetical protein
MIARSISRASLALLALTVAGTATNPLRAEERVVPDTYTAVTTHMSPADVELKADILNWSTDEQRGAVISALAADDPVAALRELPTLGVVWRSGSAVGYSIKYAHRDAADDGTETITLVTDRAVGSTSFMPWTAEHPAVESSPPYSVIELETGAGAKGTMSLAAPVVIDEDAKLVSLDMQGSAPLLANVVKQPPPYWARSSD